MEYAKKMGYTIHLIYITTKDPDLNVARVRTRFNQGGHNVPEDKIRARYGRSTMHLKSGFIKKSKKFIFSPLIMIPRLLQQENSFR